MNEVFKISLLRVNDKNDLLETTPLRVINDKSDLESLFCSVEFKGNMYSITSNPEYYKYAMDTKEKYLQVYIKEEDIENIINQLVENVSSQILNPMETALIYEEIFEFTNVAQSVLSKRLNKTQGAISNKLRLLKLPMYVQSEIIKGTLRERHGRALLLLNKHPESEKHIKELTKKIIDTNLIVADLENEVNLLLGNPTNRDVTFKVKELKEKKKLKNTSAIVSINQLEKDIDESVDLIKSLIPNLEVDTHSGVHNKDYIINITLKNVDGSEDE
ncbi:MAG: ParB/RepB/Spo0J family partition protein [Mycoplasmatales bacterium]